MGLTKHMMLEEMSLEDELDDLMAQIVTGGNGDPVTAKVARAMELALRLGDLQEAQCGYDRYLGDLGAGQAPATRFEDHRAEYERLRDADGAPPTLHLSPMTTTDGDTPIPDPWSQEVSVAQELETLLNELGAARVEDLPDLARGSEDQAPRVRRAIKLVRAIGERHGVSYTPERIEAAIWQVAIDTLLDDGPPEGWADPRMADKRAEELEAAAIVAGNHYAWYLARRLGSDLDCVDAVVALHRELGRFLHEAPLRRDGLDVARLAVERVHGPEIADAVMRGLVAVRSILNEKR